MGAKIKPLFKKNSVDVRISGNWKIEKIFEPGALRWLQEEQKIVKTENFRC